MNKSMAALCCQQMGSELPPDDQNITREMLENMAEILKDNNLKSAWLSPTEGKALNWTWINNGSKCLFITRHSQNLLQIIINFSVYFCYIHYVYVHYVLDIFMKVLYKMYC